MPRNYQAISFGAAGADTTPVSSTNPLPVVGGTGGSADQVQGNVASAATDSGNPVKIGAKYNGTRPTFTDGQRGDAQLDNRGNLGVAIFNANGTLTPNVINHADALSTATSALQVAAEAYGFNGTTWDRVRGDTNGLVVQPGLSSTFWNYAAASGGIDNTTTAVTIKAAAGASVRNYLKTLTIGHDTLGASTEFAVRDGAGGTVLWRGKLQTTAVEDKTITFDPPLKGTANTLLEVVTLTAVTGDVLVNATGYTGA